MDDSAEISVCDGTLPDARPIEKQPHQPIVWRNVILCSLVHLGALYGVYLAFTSAKITTTVFAICLYQITAIGITAGSHRLWSHRAYKAKWQLRVIIIILNTIAFQNSVYEWARDHRLHHKYTDTNADPHNSNRGMFFSHVGWLLCRKHPDVIEKGRTIDTSDLLADPIVAFQKKSINAAENLAATIMSAGEGWHNYHHVFPWDYRSAELGNYKFNFTTTFIDLFTKVGWAYDLKTTSPEFVYRRALRTGLIESQDDSVPLPWGWNDRDLPQSDRMEATIVNRKQG
ncbi:delta-9 desaturase-like isoform X2 [Acyrthosiphon pisum]|uniref:Uncharacterized protein n=1 Tax=Acyrthosiphon pisum TaxID=7029 RepID=A0A8R2D4A3_ACYPI|nr:delta-9 desaturase-like isoform X2 [Acyrthosiphon pisum]|eukprot:XP_016660726.1 PREDICTED: delta-9 desaturase-like isoform X2 [Acyrthosiphon pisum]